MAGIGSPDAGEVDGPGTHVRQSVLRNRNDVGVRRQGGPDCVDRCEGLAAMSIEFFVPYEIKPKGNRGRVMYSPDGKPFVRETDKYRSNQDALVTLFAQNAPPSPISGPIWVSYTFEYPWRKHHGKKIRAFGSIPKDTPPHLGQLTKRCDHILQPAGFVRHDAP